jgi:pimeloyl-ACP methyl ester carboxylesterase
MRYDDSGNDGDALVLIHAGVFADWFLPLAGEPAVAHLRRVRVTRTGYDDAAPATPLSVADHAAECAALLRRLGVGPARVLSHSSGAVFALQLALDHPDVVSSLVLVEPPLLDSLADPADVAEIDATLGPVMGQAVQDAARGDLSTAYDRFMNLVCGPGHREAVTEALGPHGLARAVDRCGSFFTDEIPALGQWSFDPGTAARVTQPVRLVAGGASPDVVQRLVTHLTRLLPAATAVTLPGRDHLLPLTAPAELAALLGPEAFVTPETTTASA